MAVTLVNPEGLPEIDVYRQVSVATGSKLIHVAGQVAWDGSGDLTEQTAQAYLSVATALAGVGASFDDVVKLTVHVVDWSADRMPALLAGLEQAKKQLGSSAAPPASLFGIAALDVPEHLVEIEATAVLD
ncbi:putative endoribonuclease L-PSP [Actinoplanes missouriensis 431]|uniref:Putative endoribonuclease L-PSP n=1 Tax=Actinoplanes missouriensis (strain ATCC 14538 / DSM 43046 / CBS 188.64 / JCM 3121 / NBRC 102363 / NCIMB 12654 / NRRL B-3342 / UNCC 431) TaxID=512565 RepID=I0H6M3_ACTM4|nr:RidA family protein [Actinoplanes missouriensis]BAL88660.1 putative endoribonuclease L-PSP [Actinoplanes missouriensis 431]